MVSKGGCFSESQQFPVLLDTPVLSLFLGPMDTHHMDILSVCLPSLMRNEQLQRTEVDTGKKQVFTNNIPKAGFLINPQDPIPRRRHGVSLSPRPQEEGQIQCQPRKWGSPAQLPSCPACLAHGMYLLSCYVPPDATSEANCWRTKDLEGLRSRGLRSHQKVMNIPGQDWPSCL